MRCWIFEAKFLFFCSTLGVLYFLLQKAFSNIIINSCGQNWFDESRRKQIPLKADFH